MNTPETTAAPRTDKRTGLAIASLVLGILAIPLSLFLVGGLLAVVGLVLGIVHLKKGVAARAMAGWGIGLAVVGLGLSVAAGYGYVRAVRFFKATLAQQAEQGPGVETWKGVVAPDISVTSLDGQAMTLADFKGKRVVLDFWATWCPPCVKEIPHFIQLAGETSRDDLVLLGISSEEVSKLKKFVSDKGVNYPIASAEVSFPPYSLITGIPTTFFIDRKGVIQEVFVGYHDFDTLKAAALAKDYEGEPKPPPSASEEESAPEEEMAPAEPSPAV
jgi:thiol-disulfide isomerase/thioredoxin